MRERLSSSSSDWTISLGRWGRTPVFLHLFFALAIIATLYLSWLAGQRGWVDSPLWLASLAVGVVAMSIALHVASHIYAATQLHIPAARMVIGPQGDFAETAAAASSKAQVVIALSGPGVNLLIALACLPGIVAATESPIWSLLNSVSPQGILIGTPWLVALKLTFWINWSLALLNLLPATPFDGGVAVRAIADLMNPHSSRRRIERYVGRIGIATGFAMVIAAALVRDAQPDSLAPPWFALSLLGVVVLFSGQVAPQRDRQNRHAGSDLFGYDFPQGDETLEHSAARVDEGTDDGPLQRWLQTRKQQRHQRQKELEAEEDVLVDEILARVHEHGLDELTPQERLILDRVSVRYRARIDPS